MTLARDRDRVAMNEVVKYKQHSEVQYQHSIVGHFGHTNIPTIYLTKTAKERVTRVRVCIYVKIETGQNFLPVLQIVTHSAGCIKC